MLPSQPHPTPRVGTRIHGEACCRHVRTMMDKSLYGIVIVDGKNSIRYVNPAAVRILGSPAEVLFTRPFPLQLRQKNFQELNLHTPGGREILVEGWGVETEWEGEPASLVSFQEITARKKSEEELKKMSQAVQASPVMVVITDADGTIEYVNAKFIESTGFANGESIGRNLFQWLNTEKGSDLFAPIREAVSSGKEWHGETVCQRENGEPFHQAISIAPVHDRNGKVSNLVAIMEDVSERRRYEEQLRSSEQQLAEAQKIAHLGSWKRYLDTGKSFWSDELFRIFGLEPGSVSPSMELFLSIVHPDDREQVRRVAWEALERHHSFKSHYCRIIRPDGSVRVLLGKGEIVVDDNGNPVMMIGTALDVTERKLMEDEIEKLNAALEARATELERANSELEAFSYTVCHDLRSPLTNIQGYCQVLEELLGEQLDEQCRRYLQEVARGTERMNHLIQTLLEFSLVTSRDLHLEKVDLSEMAQDVAADLKLAERERPAEIRIQPKILVTGDGALLRIVLQNLLENAWKYTAIRTPAIIEFGSVAKQGTPVLFVSDNGIGFSQEEGDKLFAPFHRLRGTDHIKGHGIGLSTVQRIIQRHGGKIWAEGEPDGGATFFFTLPFQDHEDQDKGTITR